MAFQYLMNSHVSLYLPPLASSSSASSLAAPLPSPHGRRRGPPRLSGLSQKHMRAPHRPSTRDITPNPLSILEYRDNLEQWISFDLDDDLQFCPLLVTDNNLISHGSTSSECSSLQSSPRTSPYQSLVYSHSFSSSSSFMSAASSNPIPTPPVQQQAQPIIHQSLAGRTNNAIPIINPLTGMPSPQSRLDVCKPPPVMHC